MTQHLSVLIMGINIVHDCNFEIHINIGTVWMFPHLATSGALAALFQVSAGERSLTSMLGSPGPSHW